MKLFRTGKGIVLSHDEKNYLIDTDWDELINRENLHSYLLEQTSKNKFILTAEKQSHWENLQPPIGKQEVWAAGVTYLRSRDARMEESKNSGGATLYDHVYEADRPELFFKANASRVAGPGEKVHIRKDSQWNVPEPELTLFINSKGSLQGYTIGNDMSSRSIEGENPLYLPQAKIYQRSAAIGPCLYVPGDPLPKTTVIEMEILRGGEIQYSDRVPISQIKRTFEELIDYLYRECDFEHGAFLMTGTCLIPPDGFTLQENDVVNIKIEPIGVLTNIVAQKKRTN